MSGGQKSLKDAKAEQVKKNKRTRRRKRIIVLLVEIVLLAILLFLGYMLHTYGKIDIESMTRYF